MSEASCCHCGELFPYSPKHIRTSDFAGSQCVREPEKRPGKDTKCTRTRITGSTRRSVSSNGPETIRGTGKRTAKSNLTKQKEIEFSKPSETARRGLLTRPLMDDPYSLLILLKLVEAGVIIQGFGVPECILIQHFLAMNHLFYCQLHLFHVEGIGDVWHGDDLRRNVARRGIGADILPDPIF